MTLGRFYIRWKRFKSARWDDAFSGLAALCLITFTSLDSWRSHGWDEGSDLGQRIHVATNFLMWIVLYSVKASFLAFIRYIFKVSDTFRRAWWAVTIFTVLTFWGILLPEFWICGSPSNLGNFRGCDEIQNVQSFYIPMSWLRFLLHISSDILILVLPLQQTLSMRLSRAKKISVAAVFGLIIIDIISGIVRNVSIICMFYENTDVSTAVDLAIYGEVIEPCMAVIVCSLPVYRVLIPSKPRDRSPSPLLKQAANGIPRMRDDSLLDETVDVSEVSREEPKLVSSMV